MIRSYRDKDTERFAAGEKVRQWEPFRRQAEKRLRILDAVRACHEITVPFRGGAGRPERPPQVECLPHEEPKWHGYSKTGT